MEEANRNIDSITSGDVGTLFQRALDLIQNEYEERTWRAFWGVIVDDRPSSDVADELGMTANAVYLAKSRVLRWLREEIGDLAT